MDPSRRESHSVLGTCKRSPLNSRATRGFETESFSKQALQSKLHGPWSAVADRVHAAQITRGALVIIAVHQYEIRMVEDIEYLPAELYGLPLARFPVLLQAQVDVRLARRVQNV